MKNKKYILMTMMFLAIFISTLAFIYFTSADFVKTPEIILPNEKTEQEIKYNNKYLVENIEINAQTAVDIINILERPTEYKMTISNTIYAFDIEKNENIQIYIKNDKMLVSENDKKTIVLSDDVYIIKNSQTKKFKKADFSNDDLMRIPTYEQINSSTFAEKRMLNAEECIYIENENENQKNCYYISLASGILLQYEKYEKDNLTRKVYVTSSVIGKIDDLVFTVDN